MDEALLIRIPEKIAISILVINGVYGTGNERKIALEEDGYNYQEIQKCVNELYPVFEKWSDK